MTRGKLIELCSRNREKDCEYSPLRTRPSILRVNQYVTMKRVRGKIKLSAKMDTGRIELPTSRNQYQECEACALPLCQVPNAIPQVMQVPDDSRDL